MKELPKFSVLMSVYNKENSRYLDEALKSVFEQTLPPNEVVVVEDGLLSDVLEEVINNYKNKYKNILKIIKFTKNRGLGSALNDGIKECSYEYIARMDTDDICRNDRFEREVAFLDNNPSIDVIGSNMIEYDENMEKIKSKKIVPEHHDEIVKYIKRRNPMNHPTVIFKKSKVLESNNYEDYPFFEDYHLWAKMIKNGCKFYNIQDDLYFFRAGDSMIKRRGGTKYLGYIKKLEKSLLSLKIINLKEYLSNIIIRYICAIIPSQIRSTVYKSFLRKN